MIEQLSQRVGGLFNPEFRGRHSPPSLDVVVVNRKVEANCVEHEQIN